jgi:hypothetical protein
MWTVNDFLAYADLSGWITKGQKACPCCMHSTRSAWLTYGRKQCYMRHMQWLPHNHRWRMNKKTFDGTQELGKAPVVLDGEEILRHLQEIEHQDANEEVVGKKKSIFFNLPHLKDNLLRHNLHVKHIEDKYW